MQATHYEGVDGQTLISVTFERQAPDAAVPTIEAIFWLINHQSYAVRRDIGILAVMSITDTKTRSTVELSDDEMVLVMQSAADHAAEVIQEELGD